MPSHACNHIRDGYTQDISRRDQQNQVQQLDEINITQTTIQGKRISRDPEKFMRQVLQKEIMEKYYKKKLSVDYEHVNWSTFSKALKKQEG